MAKRVIDDATLKAIADSMRQYSNDLRGTSITPQEMAEKMEFVYNTGHATGLQTGYEFAEAVTQQIADAEKLSLSMSLSEALTSGGENGELLEDNINQAKSDIGAIKTLIESNGVEVPVGTPSSTYDEKLEQIFEERHTTGVDAGRIFGEEEGRKAQYDEFWDVYQNKGKRTDYRYQFQRGWNGNTFKPKYDIKFASRGADNLFNNNYERPRIDLRKEALGVELDFSAVTFFNNTFSWQDIVSAVGVIDTRSATDIGNILSGAHISTVEKFIFRDDGSQTNCSFQYAYGLANVAIEGVINWNVTFADSTLTKTSIMGKLITVEEYEALSDSVKNNNVFELNGNYYYGGIITALKSDATGKTLTLKKSAVETAFERIYAASYTWDLEFGEDDWEPIVWTHYIGDAVAIGEYVYISGTNTNIVIQKTGDLVAEPGFNEGRWTLVAHGADLRDEWGDLIASKSNWTISLV